MKAIRREGVDTAIDHLKGDFLSNGGRMATSIPFFLDDVDVTEISITELNFITYSPPRFRKRPPGVLAVSHPRFDLDQEGGSNVSGIIY